MRLTTIQIFRQRELIIDLLSSTHRSGIEKVISYLDSVHFFTAPSSIDRHHNWKGGLAQHSLGTYFEAVRLNHGKTSPSLIISALLHDVCKGRQFFSDSQGNLHRRRIHLLGHGKRSVKLLALNHFTLSPEEYRAIRWHMHGGHPSPSDSEGLSKAKTERLHNLIHKADHNDAKCGPCVR